MRPTDDDALVVPLLASTPEDDAAELTRRHLKLAGVTRPALYTDTATTVQANFRSWRDSGITWLAMAEVAVERIMRRAGPDDARLREACRRHDGRSGRAVRSAACAPALPV